MGVMCWMLGHEGGPTDIWNEGYYFARCRRCACDLIRTTGNWSPVPLGYRVNWRSGLHRHAIASDFKRNLPLPPDEPRRWRLALHRVGLGVLLLPGPPPERRLAEREATAGLPHMVLLGMLTALGMFSRLRARGH
jgi:hypothetical protein